MGIILQPFAWLLLFFYRAFNSYGLALIIFGIVIKLLLFPVTLKSKKSMIQTSMLSEKMQRLQKQYGKDKERYNLEVQKLYEKENVNPMGGCLWSLIPMFVLIALFGIIREPLTYFMHLSLEQIQLLAQELDWEHLAVSSGWVAESKMASLQEDLAAGKITSLFQNIGYNQLYLVSQITAENLESVKAAMNAHTAGAGDGLFVMNFQFLGLDMSVIPTWKFWTGGIKWSSIGLFLLPLVSTMVSFLSMKVSMATNRMNNQTQNAQADQTNRMMMWSMPLMSLWIGFTVPAGLSVYWITQYFVTMIQEVICGKMLKRTMRPPAPPPPDGSRRSGRRRSAARRRPAWSAPAGWRRRRKTGAKRKPLSRRTRSPRRRGSTGRTAGRASGPMPGAGPISLGASAG